KSPSKSRRLVRRLFGTRQILHIAVDGQGEHANAGACHDVNRRANGQALEGDATHRQSVALDTDAISKPSHGVEFDDRRCLTTVLCRQHMIRELEDNLSAALESD